MKHRLLTLMLLLLATFPTEANPVDMKTASKAAQSFLSSKMGSSLEIQLIDFAERATLSSFYVFGNDQCFVIIAADDCVHPVLGYSLENAFGTYAMPENVVGWLRAYDEDIAKAVTNKTEATNDIKGEWANLLSGQGLTPKTRTSVAPLVRTTWNQTAPYNNLCPTDPANDSSSYNGHTPTGCVATAMAQIMNYWEHPIRGIGSHSYTPYTHPEYGEQYADFGATVYDWDNMKNDYSDGYTEEEANAVATLIYHCGVSLDMDYSSMGSGAVSQYTPDVLRNYFDYDSTMSFKYKSNLYNGDTIVFYTDDAWVRLLKIELDAERPMIYRGAGDSSSHSFICDGYDENDNFHFNWGWGGRYNGFYTLGAVGDFSFFNGALIGCKPNIPSINPPTNVNVVAEGRDVGISWDAVSEAVSYKLYRDGDLVASNLISTSYTDTNLMYGTYSYYVKSMANDGTMSLKSEISTVEVYFPGPVPVDLQATMTNNNVNLSWMPLMTEDRVLHYGIDNYVSHCGYGGSRSMYWAQRYPSQVLLDNNVEGMAINKIAVYSHSNDNAITAYIYKGSAGAPEELLYQTSMTLDNSGWQDISVNVPVPIDYTKDLWIVLYADSTVLYPAAYCNYTGEGQDNALYISLDGNNYWKWNIDDRSWMIKTYATDGTYTYNLYRNNTIIADEITASSYQDNNLPDDHYVYYVTTNYYGGESNASNEVEVMIGNPQYAISATANPTMSGSVSGGGMFGYGQTCTLTATANTDCMFLNWTEGNDVVSANATYNFVVKSNRNLIANFVPQYYQVLALSIGGGSVSGGGTHHYGQTCTLTAIPHAGHLFTFWTKDGEIVSTNPTIVFSVKENATYTASFTNAPSGALNGLFSVGDSKQVRFSQGNLQYQASTGTWRFAENQWNYVGGSFYGGNVYNDGVLCNNELISSEYDGWIDLFGWGTSGYDHGAVCYQPWSTSIENSNYFAYNNHNLNLGDETGQADWGANPIANGGNISNQWRTLSNQEWQYLFNSRPGIRYAKAKVNNLSGVILLPDNWDENSYDFSNPNLGTAPFESNVISLEEWNVLEVGGAVFLPVTGVRHENSVTLVGSYCGYWSSTHFDYNSNCAYCLHLYTDYISPNNFHYRNNGYAVRLVTDSDITQSTNFSQGWNWWSSYIDLSGVDGLAMLEESLGENGLVIKSRDAYVEYSSQTGWTGSLQSIDNESGYKVKVAETCTSVISGPMAVSGNHPITLNQGWNWVGNPVSEAQTVTSALSGFTPAEGDILKGQDAYATYSEDAGWTPSDFTLNPGESYMYYSNHEGEKILIINQVGTK